MFTVHIEMPSGATSKPREFMEEVPARNLFASFVDQMLPWKKFHAAVVLMEDDTEFDRREINNAA